MKKPIATFLTLLMCGTLMLLNLAASSVTDPPTKSTGSPVHSPPRNFTYVNPHLKGIAASSSKKKEATKEKGKDLSKEKARRWHRAFSYTEWATLHRGLGTVRGQVHNAAGSAMSHIRVALRTSKGRVISNVGRRHVTYTSSSGMFVMKNVRIGTYRVRASKGKAAGSSAVHVRGGTSQTVSVKL